MVSDIPKQGIRVYMDAKAYELTPANWAWKVREWFMNGPGTWLIILGIVSMLFGGAFLPSHLQPIATYLPLSIPLALIVVIVLTFTTREPGYWRRYSVFHCLQRYPAVGKCAYEYVERIRRERLGAEFEVAVLERKHKCYGAVLFQVLPQATSQEDEEGIPVQVFSADGIQTQFGEGYIAPLTLQI